MMIRSHRFGLKRTRGQAAVELAFSVPLLIVLLLVVVEAGRICLVAVALSSAARAGVQYGAQSLTTVSDTAGMQNAAKADAPNLTGMTATGSYYCQCSDGSASTCLSTDCCVQSPPHVCQGGYQRDLHPDRELAGSSYHHHLVQPGDHAGSSMTLRYRRHRSQRGTSMAEFALIAIPCLTLFFGIMNFAMALY